MRLPLLISCFLCIAYSQGNGVGKNPEFEEPVSVISLPGSGPTATATTATTSTTSDASTSSSSTLTTSVTTTATTTTTDSTTISATSPTTTFSQTPLSTPPPKNNSKSGTNNMIALIIAGSIVAGIVVLGIIVFIYRKIRGLDDEDFKIERESPEPFSHNKLSAPDYGRSALYGSQQYAVYPTVGRPGLPGFVEKGQIVETPNTIDSTYYGSPDFGYHPEYYNQFHVEHASQYSNGYQVTRPNDSLHGARQY